MRVRDGVAFFGKPRSHGQDLGSLILGWPQEVLVRHLVGTAQDTRLAIYPLSILVKSVGKVSSPLTL